MTCTVCTESDYEGGGGGEVGGRGGGSEGRGFTDGLVESLLYTSL